MFTLIVRSFINVTFAANNRLLAFFGGGYYLGFATA
jgi:hypothetical protein